MRRAGDEAFESLGVGLQDIDAPVANMSGGQRQGVAVSRAVTWASKVVFMDEPTAALGVVQTRQRARPDPARARRGIAVVLISHNMPEVFEVADRIEVLRLGERVAQYKRADVAMEDIVGAMTGALGRGEAHERRHRHAAAQESSRPRPDAAARAGAGSASSPARAHGSA